MKQRPPDTPEDVMYWAIRAHHPDKVYACFSGGHDSLVSTDIAMHNGAHEVLHVNTGIGIEETRQFVRDTCADYDWILNEVRPPNTTYRDFVLQHGFPGPAAHKYAYSWLKERAIRKVVREAKIPKNEGGSGIVMLVTGVRNQESARRMGFVEPICREGGTVWVAPIYGFSKDDCNAYIDNNRLERNRVVELMHMSGECLCGSFAKPGELARLKVLFPAVAKEIEELSAEAEMVGKPSQWGDRPAGTRKTKDKVKFMPLCVGCETRRTE